MRAATAQVDTQCTGIATEHLDCSILTQRGPDCRTVGLKHSLGYNTVQTLPLREGPDYNVGEQSVGEKLECMHKEAGRARYFILDSLLITYLACQVLGCPALFHLVAEATSR